MLQLVDKLHLHSEVDDKPAPSMLTFCFAYSLMNVKMQLQSFWARYIWCYQIHVSFGSLTLC